jgi:hypothetical protein
MNAYITAWVTSCRVELRRGEKRAGLAQDFIGALQFSIFALQRMQSLTLVGLQAGPLPRVALRPSHPQPQRLRRTPDLVGNRPDRGPLRLMRALLLQQQPYGSLPDLGRERLGRTLARLFVFRHAHKSHKAGSLL